MAIAFPFQLMKKKAAAGGGPPTWVKDSRVLFDMDFANARYYGAQPSDLVSGVLDTTTLVGTGYVTKGCFYLEANSPGTPFGNYYMLCEWKNSSNASTPYISVYAVSGSSNIRHEYVGPGYFPVATQDQANTNSIIKVGFGWDPSGMYASQNGGAISTFTQYGLNNTLVHLGIGIGTGGAYAYPNGRSATGLRRIAFLPAYDAGLAQTISA